MARLQRCALIPALLAAGLAPSCSSTPAEPEPVLVSVEIEAASDRLLWRVVLLALRKMDFPEGADLDPVELHAASGWRIELAPFKGRGFREMADVRCTPVGPGRWRVDVRVKRQTNESLIRPLDISYAEWEWAPDDQVAARILLQHIRTFLGPEIELSPEEEDPLERFLERRRPGKP